MLLNRTSSIAHADHLVHSRRDMIYPTTAAVSFVMFCIPQKKNLCIRTAASVTQYLSPSLTDFTTAGQH